MLFRAAITALVIAAIGLVGWRLLSPAGDLDGGIELNVSAPEGSDYFMRGATIYQMNEAGQLDYRMKIAEILHYPDDSARLHDIHTHYVGGSKSWWSLQAPRGLVPPGSRDIHLIGGVVVKHPQPEGDTVVIRTDHAWFRSQANLIETNAHATATSPDRIVEGDGMRITLDNDHLKLLDNVHVRYK